MREAAGKTQYLRIDKLSRVSIWSRLPAWPDQHISRAESGVCSTDRGSAVAAGREALAMEMISDNGYHQHLGTLGSCNAGMLFIPYISYMNR